MTCAWHKPSTRCAWALLALGTPLCSQAEASLRAATAAAPPVAQAVPVDWSGALARQPGQEEGPAWPRTATGQPRRCWRTQVLNDLRDGWPGQCLGLQRTDLRSLETCRVACMNEPQCSVWQYSAKMGCWQGQGWHCKSRKGYPYVQLDGSQRLLHGEVRLRKRLVGVEVRGLRNVGIWGAGSVAEEVEHCKKMCYSDLGCNFWQYGEGGCWLEDGKASAPVGLSVASDFARTVVDGESIEHFCPAQSISAAAASAAAGSEAGDGMGWRDVPYSIAAALSLLLLSCLLFCAWDASGGLRHKAKHSRATELLPREGSEEEDSLLSSLEGGRRWSVRVDKSAGAKVGLDMDYGDRRTLLVKAIQAGGLLAQWNKACEESAKVRVGDRVVAVNGLEGASKGVQALMEEMRREQVLVLTVQREDTRPDVAQQAASPARRTSLINLPGGRQASGPAQSTPHGGAPGQVALLPVAPGGKPVTVVMTAQKLLLRPQQTRQSSAPPSGTLTPSCRASTPQNTSHSTTPSHQSKPSVVAPAGAPTTTPTAQATVPGRPTAPVVSPCQRPLLPPPQQK